MPYIVKDYFQKKAIEECKGEFSEEYDSVRLISPNEYVVSKNGKFGIYSVDGFQTKLEYDDISLADEYGDFEYGNLVDLKLKNIGIVIL